MTWCLLLAFALCSSGPSIPEPVRAAVLQSIANGDNAGAVIGVIDASGQRTFAGFGGVRYRADGTAEAAPDENTVFEIGSITKVFTSLVLASMVVDGTVALVDPVAKHLPSSVTVPSRNGQQIELVHLATHRSGLPRIPTNMAMKDPLDPYADYTVDEMYAFLSAYQLPRDIGAGAEYSNLAVGLLGHALALTEGESYEALVRERVLGELGMKDTTITLTPALRARLAQPHVGITEVKNWELPTLAGAGALRSTAADMLAFAYAAMRSCLPEGSADPGGDSPLREAFRLTLEPRAEMGPRTQCGLGWVIQEVPPAARIYWHNGGTGGYRSFVGLRGDGSLGVVVLTNSDSDLDDLGFRVLADKIPLKPRRTDPSVEPALLDRYAGRYQLSPGATLTVWHRGPHLFAQLTGQAPFAFHPDSNVSFRNETIAAQLLFEPLANAAAADDDAVTLRQAGRDQRASRIADAKGVPAK